MTDEPPPVPAEDDSATLNSDIPVFALAEPDYHTEAICERALRHLLAEALRSAHGHLTNKDRCSAMRAIEHTLASVGQPIAKRPARGAK